MIRHWVASILAGLLVVACSGHQEDDLDVWMKEQKKNIKGRIEPLPELKKYDPFVYDKDGTLTDPFKGRKVASSDKAPGLQPDLKRSKEPLEGFPLESLAFVGYLEQGRQPTALVAAPDGNIYQAHLGNYMGQNYGVVIKMDKEEILIKELVQDGAGEYTERKVPIYPKEPNQQK